MIAITIKIFAVFFITFDPQLKEAPSGGSVQLLCGECFPIRPDGFADLCTGGQTKVISVIIVIIVIIIIIIVVIFIIIIIIIMGDDDNDNGNDESFRGNRSGVYEFFRGKAWVCGHALVGMAKVVI